MGVNTDVKRFPVVSTIVAFLSVVILLKLGFWQLQRAEEKREILAERAVQADSAVTDLEAIAIEGAANDFQTRLVTGVVDNKRLVYWDNRVVNGQVGYEVLAMVRTNTGNLVVNFGWVADKTFRKALPSVALPDQLNKQLIELYLPKRNLLVAKEVSRSDSWPVVIQQPDLVYIEQLLGADLLGTIGFLKNSDSYDLVNNYRPVTMTPEKHIGYAIQWFSLAFACCLIYLFALKKKWRDD